MAVSNPSFPSSKTFDIIAEVLKSEEARKDFIKRANGVFTFTLKNAAGDVESWHIDLKTTGAIGKGVPAKSDVTMLLSDEDFQKLVDGKAQAQRLFMSGKLKIKGDVMKATKAEAVLKSARKAQAKL